MWVDDSQHLPIKVWLPAEEWEQGAMSQARDLANLPFAFKHVAIMPDSHVGYGMPIGGVLATQGGIIIPNAVGVDIGCFSGDTLVPLLDGTQRNLRDLVALGGEHGVYSVGKDGNLAPGWAKALMTRRDATLVRVVISGGAHIDCTPDHEFMLSDGTYCSADKLVVGQGLAPLYRTHNEYETCITRRGKSVRTHRAVKVAAVTALEGRQDVYCLSVEEHHNFALTAGVFVHNCGMIVSKTSLTEIETDALKRVMARVRVVIPLGFSHHAEPQTWEGFDRAPDLPVIQRQLPSARKQIGTLGGGNHFIEIQAGDDGHIWLMIHSGSRNFGLQVAGEYHKAARRLCERWQSDIPNADLSFLPIDTDEGHAYYTAMGYCLEFARASRQLMMQRLTAAVTEETGGQAPDTLDIHHNYAAFEHHFGTDVLVHRKGATQAKDGQTGIVPGSMGSPSYITSGLGSLESFESSSHGAGRKMGRNQAKRSLVLEVEQAKMSGIVHGLRSVGDLDEAPGAYKDIDAVMENQRDLTRVVTKLMPLASIKG